MPKVGGKRKKTRTHAEEEVQEETDLLGRIPKAFIIKRGKVPNTMKTLVSDFREIMYPYTSMNLRENDKTTMKDYMKAAGYYQMSHMVIFTATKKSAYLRFIKNPGGPTITFKILGYSNRKDVLAVQRTFKSFSRTFSPALLVMNGFNVADEDIKASKEDQNAPTQQHIKLAATMLQSMFPPINVKKTKPEHQKRTLLFSYNAQRDVIYMRHFQILFSHKGIDKKMKKIIKANKLPNLAKYNSFSDFLGQDHQMFQSDTEASDIEGAELSLDKPFTGDRSKRVKSQMSVRLHEVGPRLQLRLYKIEEAVLKGNVLYHRNVLKTTTAIEKQRRLLKKRYNIKQARKLEQQQHVDDKEYTKNQKKNKQYENEDYQEEYEQNEEQDQENQEVEPVVEVVINQIHNQKQKQKKRKAKQISEIEIENGINDEFNVNDKQQFNSQNKSKKIKK